MGTCTERDVEVYVVFANDGSYYVDTDRDGAVERHDNCENDSPVLVVQINLKAFVPDPMDEVDEVVEAVAPRKFENSRVRQAEVVKVSLDDY